MRGSSYDTIDPYKSRISFALNGCRDYLVAVLILTGCNAFFCLSLTTAMGATRSSVEPQLVVQTGHTRIVTTLAFSANGRWLASVGDGRVVRLWEVSTGLQLRPLAMGSLEGALVVGLAFSPDNQRLAAVSDHRLTVWELATGRELWTRGTGGPETFNDIAFSPKGILALGEVDHSGGITRGELLRGDEYAVKLYDTQTGTRASYSDCSSSVIRFVWVAGT